jgi:hypothetical protein
MSSDEEDKYFKKRDAEKIAKAHRERQLEAIRSQERAGVQDALQSSPAVAQEALSLGFDSETARVLPLVPLIQMAWVDGSVSSAESAQVFKLADRFGIKADSPAQDFLSVMLDERPSELFFERVNHVIAHLLQEEPDYWTDKSVLELSAEVAKASGGFFKLTNPISSEERDLLVRFAELFSVEDARAQDVLSDDEE